MEEVRAFKLKKYMEFIVGESSIENKFKFINIPKESIITRRKYALYDYCQHR